MYIVKRSGTRQKIMFDKITARVRKLCYGLDKCVDPTLLTGNIATKVTSGMTTSEIDELTSEVAAHLSSVHPDFGDLASRIEVSNLHKDTLKSFVDTSELLFANVDRKTKQPSPLVSAEYMQVVRDHREMIENAIVYDRDYDYDYFGFKTLRKGYLIKINGRVVERPQHLLMRVAIGIHGANIESAILSYQYMSQRWFTHASPTLFGAGTPRPQLSSCFLLTIKADSIRGIYHTLGDCADISKEAGGIGLAVHDIRSTGSYIRGTNGTSNGIVPMLRVFNNTARYVDQGGGKRKGAFAIYLEPWHADVYAFLDLRKNHGIEEDRARDLFYGLWVPDLFMERVESDGKWSLFCPNEAPGLANVWGPAFNSLYTRYEAQEGLPRKTVDARHLWQAILEAQVETGTPYMLYKDHCNGKSNQQNLGTIRSSNLCTEIIEYTAPDEIAVCNLASIALPMFVDRRGPTYDFQKLYEVTYHVCKNLNRVIDINYYPVPEAKKSNMRHRPIGIGVQGLADAFIFMRFPFDSVEAAQLNKDIFETLYFAALHASKDLAKVDGPYETYAGSPVSKGVLQYDMWGVTPSKRWDWAALKREIAQHGIRNSLLIAPMPTASTSQILGNNECFEPYTSNLYVRRTLAGEFVCVQRHLLRDLLKRGLWNAELKSKLIAANGSVQFLDIPKDLKALYKTVWEIKGKVLIDMAADRGAFIDQSQSLNVFMPEPNFGKLTSMHFHAWKRGLKTGMYYLRTQAATEAIKFTVDAKDLKEAEQAKSDDKKKKAEAVAVGEQKKEEVKANPDLEQIKRLESQLWSDLGQPAILETVLSPRDSGLNILSPARQTSDSPVSSPNTTVMSPIVVTESTEDVARIKMLCKRGEDCVSCGS